MKGKKLQLLFRKNKIKMIAAALLALFVVGETFAWIAPSVEVDNELTAHTTKVEIEENFEAESDSIVTKEVSFKNSGSSDAFIRMRYEEYWTYTESDATYQLPNRVITTVDGTEKTEEVATKIFNTTENEEFSKLWELDEDGWYYYKKILPEGASTADVLKTVNFPIEYTGALEAYKDATYHLYFTVESLQASTSSSTLNRDEVNTNATTKVFGREGIIYFDFDMDGDGVNEMESGIAYPVEWK